MRTVPCRGARWAVSWPPPKPCRAGALLCLCTQARTGAPCRSAVSRAGPHRVVALSSRIARLLRCIVVHARSYCSVVARRVTTYLAIHPAARPPSGHDMPICIVTHPQRPGHARASAVRPARRPAVSQGLLAVSQRPAVRQPGRVTPPIARPGLHPQPCVTIQFPVS